MKQHDELITVIVGLVAVVELAREHEAPIPPEVKPMLDMIGTSMLVALRNHMAWSSEEAVKQVKVHIAALRGLV